MHFELIPAARDAQDEDLIPLAGRLGPVARIWTAPRGLVVPRTYTRSPRFAEVSARFLAQGWPISVRLSGGGVVPQGSGILNLSLALPVRGRPMDHSEAAYLMICRIIQAALAPLGIDARSQAVEGSFCDGRFNLAVGEPARKVAGTAQVWRHIPATPADIQVGLVHALILVQVDPLLLTGQANRLEEALDNPRRYLSTRIASLDRLRPPDGKDGFAARFQAALITALGQDWVLHPPAGPSPA